MKAIVRRNRTRNLLHSALLLLGILALFSGVGWSVGGWPAVAFMALVSLTLFVLGPRVSSTFELWLMRARPLLPREAPELFRAVEILSERAKLPATPRLFLLPIPQLQALTLGTPRSAAVALTHGMLRRLETRELIAILAHELCHIRHRDLRIMGLADSIARATNAMAFVGWILLAINLPFWLWSQAPIPWLCVVLLIVAPRATLLLRMALSRAREFDADVGAVELTGDPVGLANALSKVEHFHRPLWRRLLRPGGEASAATLLQTHPATADRIARLRAMIPPPPRPVDSGVIKLAPEVPVTDSGVRVIAYVVGPDVTRGSRVWRI